MIAARHGTKQYRKGSGGGASIDGTAGHGYAWCFFYFLSSPGMRAVRSHQPAGRVRIVSCGLVDGRPPPTTATGTRPPQEECSDEGWPRIDSFHAPPLEGP